MIGRIESVPLREVWKNEAKDFTSWLFNNIEVLSDEIGLNLIAQEQERKIGRFSCDITAEDPSGTKIVIENQLEKTDHDHLGKILTYCTNFEAKIAIWITSNPRPEHQKAIEWLNENTTNLIFYLVKIEAFEKLYIEEISNYQIYSETLIEYLDRDYQEKSEFDELLDIKKYFLNYSNLGMDYEGTMEDLYLQIREGLK